MLESQYLFNILTESHEPLVIYLCLLKISRIISQIKYFPGVAEATLVKHLCTLNLIIQGRNQGYRDEAKRRILQGQKIKQFEVQGTLINLSKHLHILRLITIILIIEERYQTYGACLLYTSPSPRD